MQCNINSLIGNNIEALDGQMGEVKEFYFDDKTWTIRYLVLKTNNWFLGREILISTYALIKNLWEPGTFLVNIKKEQVRSSPDIDTTQPIYRQHEIELHKYYAWQNYWDGAFYAGGLSALADPYAATIQKRVNGLEHSGNAPESKQHLRSSLKVVGYQINATDGDIGEVKDFVIDNKTWELIYLVADTHHWFDGKMVLIPITHITEVDWQNSIVVVDVTKDVIKSSNVFNKWQFQHPENGHSYYIGHTIHTI